MTTSHTPDRSFEKALKALEMNAIGADAIKAIKVCQAADALLAALRRIEKISGTYNPRFPMGSGYHAEFVLAMDAARAAIVKATA